MRHITEGTFCLLAAAVILAVCSRSSFLYAFNNWDDANSYFTVGKGIMNGLMPYRDLFDQKGPLLYFLYGIAYLISHTTFRGVYVIEVLCGAADLLAVFRIISLYTEGAAAPFCKAIPYLLTPVTGMLMFSSRSFYWGGSAEEMLLPSLLWGLYLLMRYFKKLYPAPLPDRTVFAAGILAGCVFLIKFNSLGFYFGFMVMVLIADLTEAQQSEENGSNGGCRSRSKLRFTVAGIKRFLRHCGFFLSGMFLSALPWILFFAIRGALYDLFHVYIYLNAFVYSEKLPFAERLYRMLRIIYAHMRSNWQYSCPAALGLVLLFVRAAAKKGKWTELAAPVMTGGFLLTGIFIGGVELLYYPFPAAAFACLGAAGIAALPADASGRGSADLGVEKTEKKAGRMDSRIAGLAAAFGAAGIGIGVLCALLLSMNVHFMKYEKDDLWMYHFRDRIAESGIKAPTLLNVNCFDAGLYTVADILPTCRFFQTQTIKLDDVALTQQAFIDEGRTDFVLSRDHEPQNIGRHYRKIAEEVMEQSENTYVYYLYEKAD